MAYTHPGGTRRCLRSGRVSRGPGDDQRTAPRQWLRARHVIPARVPVPLGPARAAIRRSPLAELEICA
jgi:hypothetical protein